MIAILGMGNLLFTQSGVCAEARFEDAIADDPALTAQLAQLRADSNIFLLAVEKKIVADAQSQLTDATTTNAALNAEIGRLQTELADLQAKYDALNAKLKAVEEQSALLADILNPPLPEQ